MTVQISVKAFRETDQRIFCLLPPQTRPELPSTYCVAEDYDNRPTFAGFEERVGQTSLVLGAQLSTTGAVGEVRDPSDDRFDLSALEPFHKRLKLRLGYWPSTSFDDERARQLDWQAKFEESSGDLLGFATFMHCLLDGAAEYSWLHA